MLHLYCYTYQKWFRPYRSEIEYEQYLSKVIIPSPMCLPKEVCSWPIVDTVRTLNADLCAEIERKQDSIRGLSGLDSVKQREKLAGDRSRVRPTRMMKTTSVTKILHTSASFPRRCYCYSGGLQYGG